MDLAGIWSGFILLATLVRSKIQCIGNLSWKCFHWTHWLWCGTNLGARYDFHQFQEIKLSSRDTWKQIHDGEFVHRGDRVPCKVSISTRTPVTTLVVMFWANGFWIYFRGLNILVSASLLTTLPILPANAMFAAFESYMLYILPMQCKSIDFRGSFIFSLPDAVCYWLSGVCNRWFSISRLYPIPVVVSYRFL